MRALVLGGTSFVGGALARRLATDGHDVTLLNRGSLPPPVGVRQLKADRKDRASLQRALAKSSWDCAFDVSGFIMATDAASFDGLLDILAGQVGRYIYVSSIMVYEPTGYFPWNEEAPKRSEPPTTYGGLKVYAERAIMRARSAGAFEATAVRPGAIYGPGNNIFDMEAAMFHRLQRGLPILLPNRGLVTTPYGHVDDLIDAIVAASAHPAADGHSFNVCEEGVTSRQYVETLAGILGVEPRVVHIDEALADEVGKPLFGHLFREKHHGTMANNKIKQHLDLPDGRDFVRGHEQTWEWFQGSPLAGQMDQMSDALWGSGFDLVAEQGIAADLGGVR